MLRKPESSTHYALQRAAVAAEIARDATDEETRQTWLSIERGWLQLAASCDLTDRVGAFMREQDSRPPEPLPRRNEIVPWKKPAG